MTDREKVFAYREPDWTLKSLAIRAYQNKKWTVQE